MAFIVGGSGSSFDVGAITEDLKFSPANTYDIGATGAAGTPKDVFISNDLIIGTTGAGPAIEIDSSLRKIFASGGALLLNSGANGDIILTPSGTGEVRIADKDLFFSTDGGADIGDVTGNRPDSVRAKTGVDIGRNGTGDVTISANGSNSRINMAGTVTGGWIVWSQEDGLGGIGSADAGTTMLRPGYIYAKNELGVGTSAANVATASVQIDSTTQGFLPPRMTTTNRDAITSPADGLVVYNTTTSKLNVYTGSAWEAITSA